MATSRITRSGEPAKSSRKPVAAVRRVGDLVSRALEQRAHEPANVVVVVDDENPGAGHRNSFHRGVQDSSRSGADTPNEAHDRIDRRVRSPLRAARAPPRERKSRPPAHAVPFTVIAVVTAYVLLFLPTGIRARLPRGLGRGGAQRRPARPDAPLARVPAGRHPRHPARVHRARRASSATPPADPRRASAASSCSPSSGSPSPPGAVSSPRSWSRWQRPRPYRSQSSGATGVSGIRLAGRLRPHDRRRGHRSDGPAPQQDARGAPPSAGADDWLTAPPPAGRPERTPPRARPPQGRVRGDGFARAADAAHLAQRLSRDVARPGRGRALADSREPPQDRRSGTPTGSPPSSTSSSSSPAPTRIRSSSTGSPSTSPGS